MTGSLLSLLYFLLLVGLCYGIGQFAVRKLFSNFLERFLFAVPIGMGIVGFALFAFGLAKLYYAPVFYAVLALGLPGWFFLLRDRFAPPAPKEGETAPAQGRNLLDLGINAVLIVLALCTLIGALAPPNGFEWDALSYHLTVPKTYLREHRMFYIPYDHHSNFPFLLQMLYTLMLGVGSVGGAKLCHWLCGVLLTVSVYTFALRIHPGNTGKRIGQVAALLIAASPIVFWEATIAYVDLATALFTWLSFYALIVHAKSETKTGAFLVLSAVLMGFAIGTKWTVLGFWGILLAGIAVYDIAKERCIRATLIKQLLLWGSISFALALPWLLRSYLYAGSPVYPYYYNIFGGNYWNTENATQYANDQATLGLGKDSLFLLLAPWLMNADPTARKFNEYGFAFSFALVPLLLAAPFKAGRWNKVAIALIGFSIVGYVFWFFLVQQTRYFVPLLPAVALIAAEVLVALWNEDKGFARYVGGVLVAASALWGMYLCVNALTTPAIRVVLGTQTQTDYVTSSQLMTGLYPAYTWINTNTPPNTKVALFDDTFGFYIDRPILWATPNHAYNLIPWDRYNTVDDWLADFKKRGYTTLLVNEANAPRPDSPLANQKWRAFLLEAIASGKVETAFEADGGHGRYVRVYRIL